MQEEDRREGPKREGERGGEGGGGKEGNVLRALEDLPIKIWADFKMSKYNCGKYSIIMYSMVKKRQENRKYKYKKCR